MKTLKDIQNQFEDKTDANKNGKITGPTKEWKEVQGYEGKYLVSSQGDIASLLDSRGRQRDPVKTLSPGKGGHGYLQVGLYRNGRAKYYRVHRLVAQAFIKNPENKLEVNHKNGIKTDNFAGNLEWMTAKENTHHAIRHGLSNPIKASACAAKINIGSNRGKTSSYHNVSFDSSKGRWRAKISQKGTALPCKSFVTEVEAAIYVNWIIDAYHLDRPKNSIIENGDHITAYQILGEIDD